VPYLLILAAPLAYAFAFYRRAFVRTAREVKRLDAISRSPLFAEVSASLVGAKTIRAFHAAPFMERKFLRLLDENGKCNYLFLVLSRWLGFRLDSLSFVFLTVLAVLSVRGVVW
jgi:ATP-binding cassette, subfamily C (CFTR/MRP), member 4